MMDSDIPIAPRSFQLQQGAVVSIRVASSTPATLSVPVVAATGTLWSGGSTSVVSGHT